MKKALSIILLIGILFSFASCGGAKETTVNIASAKEQIKEEVSLDDPMDLKTEALADLYGIEVEDVLECQALVTNGGTFPGQIIMVKVKDDDAKQRVIDAFNAKLEDVRLQSQNYNEEDYKLAQACKVLENGDCVALFVSAHFEKLEQIFNANIIEK